MPGFGPSWGTVPLACSALVAVNEYSGIDDNSGLLSNFLADFGGALAGPTPLVSCVFALSAGFPCPPAGDFSITDANFPDDPYPPPFELPSPPAMSITVSARTPVCGDAFKEGNEECDDGNAVDGDCCSSACTLVPAGTPCPDASVCTNDETCDGAGTCVVGSTLTCNDGVMCTHDFCDDALGCQALPEPTPVSAAGCDHIFKRKVRLDVRDRADNDTADRLKVKVGGLFGGDTGDPTAATDYAICIFDAVGGVYSNVVRLDIPAGAPWALRGGSGSFGYVDRTRANDGVEKIRLKRRKNGVAKFLLIGKESNLPLPGPVNAGAYLISDPNTALQIENSEGTCWSELMGPPRRNDAERFTAKQ